MPDPPPSMQPTLHKPPTQSAIGVVVPIISMGLILAIVIGVIYYVLTQENTANSDAILSNAAQINEIATKTLADIKALQQSDLSLSAKAEEITNLVLQSQRDIQALQKNIATNIPTIPMMQKSTSDLNDAVQLQIKAAKSALQAQLGTTTKLISDTVDSLQQRLEGVDKSLQSQLDMATISFSDNIGSIQKHLDTVDLYSTDGISKLQTQFDTLNQTTTDDVSTMKTQFEDVKQTVAANLPAVQVAVTTAQTSAGAAQTSANAAKTSADNAAVSMNAARTSATGASVSLTSANTALDQARVAAQAAAATAQLITDAQAKQTISVDAAVAAINADITARNAAAKTAADNLTSTTANAKAVTDLQALTTTLNAKIATANSMITTLQTSQTALNTQTADTITQIKTWQTWNTTQTAAAALNFSLLDPLGVQKLAAKYERRYIRNVTTGEIFLMDQGTKRYMINPAFATGNGSFDLPASLVNAFPTGAPIVFSNVNVSNTVGPRACPDFCKSVWGRSALAANNPAWKGALSNQATMNAAGECGCTLSNNPLYRWPAPVAGNNGAVTCDVFCAGAWGENALANTWPDAAGASVAPYASATQVGTVCECAPAFDANHRWPSFQY